MTLEIRRFADVDGFLAVSGGFLEAREAEHNLIFGISSYVRDQPNVFGEGTPYFAAALAGDRVVAVALRTPPHTLVLSEIDDPGAIDRLVADSLEDDLPGVLGPVEHAHAFAERWAARAGQSWRHHLAERIFRLRAVVPPPPVPGSLRIATPGDRDLVAAWIRAFMDEALGEDDPDSAEALTDRWLHGRGRTLYLWEDGETVSLCGVGGATPHGIRIGPVYTPPAARRRGYASALVAEASQLQLDAGRRFCFLFTDLANPTSNHVYQAIGYEPVRDVDEYRFERS
ncbi:MAG: GNAT family N-acetyltransferase [Chloroflexi bacterium]|nr:GNAT family N-acetyltransferase [Chloroflexota bacterium]